LTHASARVRAAIAGATGIAAGLVAGLVSSWQSALLTAWLFVAVTYLLLVWSAVRSLSARQTREFATAEDEGRAAVAAWMTASAVVSLAGVLIGIGKSRQLDGFESHALVAMAIGSVLGAWMVVHTVFTLRYADLYYSGEGGINFPGAREPNYRDFAYFAFTIGMTFQVSDTDITTPEIRHVVTRHALLSYLFGTCIVGITINVLGGLLG
jgi:uncharacterized membrane protein